MNKREAFLQQVTQESKFDRSLEKIKYYLMNFNIHSQNELCKLLNEWDPNLNITQRDISIGFQRIGVEKFKGVYKLPEDLELENYSNELINYLKNTKTNIHLYQSFLVITTTSGHLYNISRILKEIWYDNIIGIMLGNNLLTVYIDNHENCEFIYNELKRFLAEEVEAS